MIISLSDSRAIRKRRGIWPDVLAPGGNTFASRGYYGMQSHIAYPESGIAMYPTNQGWNPYWQGFPQQNQFNNYNRSFFKSKRKFIEFLFYFSLWQ